MIPLVKSIFISPYRTEIEVLLDHACRAHAAIQTLKLPSPDGLGCTCGI